MAMHSYKQVLRMRGMRKPVVIRRTIKADGHRELLPLGRVGIWQDGRCVVQGDAG